MSELQKIDYTEKDISERDVVDLLKEKFDRLHQEDRNMKAELELKEKEILFLHDALGASRDRINTFSNYIETTKSEYSNLLDAYHRLDKNAGVYITIFHVAIMLATFSFVVNMIDTLTK